MISSVRTSDHPSPPSSAASSSVQGTLKSRRSASRLASPRFAKSIDVFDLSALQDKLPPNTGPAGITPVTNGAGNSTTANKNLSHVPCKFFKQGICQAGSSCPFSHNLDGTLSSEKVPCKYFQKGNCRFGLKCALAHILPDGTRVNPRISMSNRRSSERNDRSRSRSDSSLRGNHNMIFSMVEGSKSAGMPHGLGDGFRIDTPGMTFQRNEESAFTSSPSSYISPSTTAFLRDQNYFDEHNPGSMGTLGSDRSLVNGNGQMNGRGYNTNEWPYRQNPSLYEHAYIEKSDSHQGGGFLASSTASISSSPVLFMTNGSPNSSAPRALGLPFQPYQPNSNSQTAGNTKAQAAITPETSPILNYKAILYEDCAVADEEEEGVFDDTLFEDYIPGSLGNLIFTPQEKKRRDSRSQSGTLLVRPDVYSESHVEKRSVLPMVANGAYKAHGEVFLMD